VVVRERDELKENKGARLELRDRSAKTVSDGRHDAQSVPNGAVVVVKRGSGNCHRWAGAFSRCDTSPENG
jgi:hypothetical protein